MFEVRGGLGRAHFGGPSFLSEGGSMGGGEPVRDHRGG